MDNPFLDQHRTPWLTDENMGNVVAHLVEALEIFPQFQHQIPWLRCDAVEQIFNERLAAGFFPGDDRATKPLSTTIRTWFRPVTQRIAQAIEQLLWKGMPREVTMIEEILRRGALAAKRRAVPHARLVARAFASYPYDGRANYVQRVDRPWQLDVRPIQASLIGIRDLLWLVRVCEAERTLAFQVTRGVPQEAEVLQVLYTALLSASEKVTIPRRMLVPVPVPVAIQQYAQLWSISLMTGQNPFRPVYLRVARYGTLALLSHAVDGWCAQEGGHAPLQHQRAKAREQGQEVWTSTLYTQIAAQCPQLLPSFPATWEADGSVVWHGSRWREIDADLGRWFGGEPVTIRPLPQTNPVVLVEWHGHALGLAGNPEILARLKKPLWSFPSHVRMQP